MATETTMAQVADKALDKSGVMIEKAAEVAGNVFEAASNIISNGIAQYGPQAVDAVLWVIRIDAIQYLAVGWIWFMIVLAWFFVMFKAFIKWDWPNRMNVYWDDSSASIPLVLGSVFGSGLLIAVFVFSVVPRITDVWKYTAIVKPEIYLVKKTVDLVEKKLEKVVSK